MVGVQEAPQQRSHSLFYFRARICLKEKVCDSIKIQLRSSSVVSLLSTVLISQVPFLLTAVAC